MLSNLITAKSLEENPEIHANNRTVKVIKLPKPAALFALLFVDTFDFAETLTIVIKLKLLNS